MIRGHHIYKGPPKDIFVGAEALVLSMVDKYIWQNQFFVG